jgi:hypothetical protein
MPMAYGYGYGAYDYYGAYGGYAAYGYPPRAMYGMRGGGRGGRGRGGRFPGGRGGGRAGYMQAGGQGGESSGLQVRTWLLKYNTSLAAVWHVAFAAVMHLRWPGRRKATCRWELLCLLAC